MARSRSALLGDQRLYSRWAFLKSAQQGIRQDLAQGVKDGTKQTVKQVGKQTWNDLVIAWIKEGFDEESFSFNLGEVLARNIAMSIAYYIRESVQIGAYNPLGGAENMVRAGIIPDGKVLYDFSQEYTARVAWYHSTSAKDGMALFADTHAMRGTPAPRAISLAMKVFGLDKRRILAVDNYEKGLIASATHPKRTIETLVARYIDKQHDHRAAAFGDTETMTGINYGQQVIFERAVQEGKLPPGTEKVWITAADESVCPTCGPMDKKRVLITDSFITPFGPVVVPPVHPNCRCTLIPDIFLGSAIEIQARLSARVA